MFKNSKLNCFLLRMSLDVLMELKIYKAAKPTREFSLVLNAIKTGFTFIDNWLSKKTMLNSE